MSGRSPVEAAGGVLWRRAGTDVEVALVHRPKYDDWSLPKGKLDDGEHPLLAGLREIEEETGFAATPGRPLGELRYRVGLRAKRVRYWACRAGNGSFVASREVDELRWLPVSEALQTLQAPRDLPMLQGPRDRPVLEEFAADLRDTKAVLVVRHASAGDKSSWRGADADRPLDELGRRQAAALVALLRAYGVGRTVTADVLRCRATLAPFETATGPQAAVEVGLGAKPFAKDPAAGIDALLALTSADVPAALCSQREVIADLVSGVCHRLGVEVDPDDVGEPGRAQAVVLHLAVDAPDTDGPVLVAWEMLPAP